MVTTLSSCLVSWRPWQWLRYSVILGSTITLACGGDGPAGPDGPTAADRTKFVGNWAGTYECSFPDPADTMFIATGLGGLGMSITLHAHLSLPDVVTGELTDVNVITIPEQTIGGFPGSGEITFANNVLSLVQRGFGVTCNGSNYVEY